MPRRVRFRAALPRLLLASGLASAAYGGGGPYVPGGPHPRIPAEQAPGGSVPFPESADPVKVLLRLKDKGPGVLPSPGTRAWEDLPVSPACLAALRARGARILTALKWSNQVSALLPLASLPEVAALPCVDRVSRFPRKARAPRLPESPFPPGSPLRKPSAGDPAYGASRELFDSLRIDEVHLWMASRGMVPGRGVRLALIDTDFHLGHAAFRRLREEGRVRDSWDFVAGGPGGATHELRDSHGAQCLSLIAADLKDTLVGAAPGAEFLLYRAEDVSQERYIEEDFVAAAIERAVDSGAQVISISLGYRDGFTDGSPDYPFAWMDGRTRPSSLAALGAARRNVLVVASIGNIDPAQSHPGPTLGAPADADSILSVGIVDRDRQRCSYSSWGPSADGRIKPDIMSMGVVPGCQVFVARTSDGQAVYSGAGTSYAAPVIAGIAALVRQARPELSAEDARQALLASGHRAARPDTLMGYGLADALAALFGPGARPPPETGRLARVYHRGGKDPLSLAWPTGMETREVRVADAAGRNIQVTQRRAGARLLLDPRGDLRTGVYLVRVKPVR